MRAFADERCTGLLADYADRLLIVRGVNYPSFGISGDSHALGLVQCLTAAEPVGVTSDATSSAPSVDTFIADALMGSGSEPLTLYAGAKGGFINERLSFSAAGSVRLAEGKLRETGRIPVTRIDMDINSDDLYDSNKLHSAAVGYIRSHGYEPHTKPDLLIASWAANVLCNGGRR